MDLGLLKSIVNLILYMLCGKKGKESKSGLAGKKDLLLH